MELQSELHEKGSEEELVVSWRMESLGVYLTLFHGSGLGLRRPYPLSEAPQPEDCTEP